MNWSDLSLLLAVSRSNTMTQAAKRLGVDQTTVSRRLDALEATLGVKLVSRRRDGIRLTEAGAEAARASEVMETVAHDLERSLVGSDTELAGSVRVTTIDLLTQFHPDLFTSFAQRYPSVELEVETDSSYRSLSRREADIAIRYTVNPEEGLFGRKLTRMEFALYAAKKLKRSVGTGAKLSSYPWLAFTAASKARLTDAWMRSNVPAARIVCRYADAQSMYAAIRSGGGVGFMPCAYADTDPKLVRLRGVQPKFGIDMWCLTHPDLSETARVRAFLAHTGGYFDARKALYAGRRKRASAK
jgi:DNA-binding transcriptional LysR family regulator